MTDKPILFSGPMVRAILDGRKTQTRRSLKPQPDQGLPIGGTTNVDGVWCWLNGFDGSIIRPFEVKIAVGDRLWVKEAHWAWGHWEKTNLKTKTGKEKWKFIRDFSSDVVFEKPDNVAPDRAHLGWHKRSSLFMYSADIRLMLTVTDVRVERLQDISEADAKAEGVKPSVDHPNMWERGKLSTDQNHATVTAFPKLSFRSIWEEINGPDAWDANPWVVAYTFTTQHVNIDKVTK